MGQHRMSHKRNSLYFTALRKIEIREEVFPEAEKGSIQVQNLCSLISAGTEMLIYKGEIASDLALDESLPSLAGSFTYPMKYGYSSVGTLINATSSNKKSLGGQRVFAFNPHESGFTVPKTPELMLPEDCSTLDALFLANMETAINIILDADIHIGERVVVIGLGVVGLLTSALLLAHPLESLSLLDLYDSRRNAAEELGAKYVFNPNDPASLEQAINNVSVQGADTVIELSGNPKALNLAMDLVGKEGKILVASWYGERRAEINLGSKFHRGRIKLISSQVGSINPALKGRWNRRRRFSLAWKWIRKIEPSRWITHKFPFVDARLAYKMLDKHPEKSIAVVLEY